MATRPIIEASSTTTSGTPSNTTTSPSSLEDTLRLQFSELFNTPEDKSVDQFLSGSFTPEQAMEKAWEQIHLAQSQPGNMVEYSRALAISEAAVARFPKHADLLALKASCHFPMRQYALALESALQALQFDPENATAMTIMIDCEDQKDSFPPSSPQMQPLTFTPTSVDEASLRYALECVLCFEHPKECAQEIERLLEKTSIVLEQQPQNVREISKKLFCLCLQGKISELAQFLGSPHEIYLGIEIFKQTLPLVNEVLTKQPNHQAALTLRMVCLYYAAQMAHLKASEEVIKGKFPPPAKPTPKEVIPLFTGSAMAAPQDIFNDVLAATEKLLENDPKNPTGLLVKIDLLSRKRQFKESIELANLMIELFPQNPFAWTLLAQSYTSAEDDRALKTIDHALMLNSKDSLIAWLVKISYLIKLDDLEAIRATALQAMDAFPNNPLIKLVVDYYLSEDQQK